MFNMFDPNRRKSLLFNNANCGIALRRIAGIRLVTTGITDCVVLQVLSNEYVFVAHLTTQSSENDNLRIFCNRVKKAFQDHGSQIISGLICHVENSGGLNHAKRILLNLRAYLEVSFDRFQIPSANRYNSSFELIVLDNLECAIQHEETASMRDRLVTNLIEDFSFSQREAGVTKLMAEAAYNGFAVSIDNDIVIENEIDNDIRSGRN